jgi:hypothetical protein
MTSEDFSQLAKTYGADIKRWPEEHRPMIGDLASTQFSTMRQILDEELALDKILNQDSIEPASQNLINSIIQSAPQPRTQFWRDHKDWLSRIFKGIGFTSIGLAGALAGMLVVSTLSPNSIRVDAPNNELANAEFMDFGQDWR